MKYVLNLSINKCNLYKLMKCVNVLRNNVWREHIMMNLNAICIQQKHMIDRWNGNINIRRYLKR